MLPDHLKPWLSVEDLSAYLGSGWPESAGIIPTPSDVDLAEELCDRARKRLHSKSGLAWVMFCRPQGATGSQIKAACGGAQFNDARKAQKNGQLGFEVVKKEGDKKVYFMTKANGDAGVEAKFVWVSFYEELADKLLDWQDKQLELIELINELRNSDYLVPVLSDRGAAGDEIPLTELDPFSFFAMLNRGITDENRRSIAGKLAEIFGIVSDVPETFLGVPVVHNTNARFFTTIENARGEGDVSGLWDVFEASLEPNPFDRSDWKTFFDRSVLRPGAGIKLTLGLFWVRPRNFVSLDSRVQKFLDLDIGKEQLNAALYRDTVRTVAENWPYFPELSYQAWLSGQGRSKSAPTSKNLPGREVMPTNLILYGPPGTGKTYATVEEAVRLCDGALPEGGRSAIKARYDELVEMKRIEFVTFHQSYGYEDFVLGLRPQPAENAGDGFSLEAVPGVFYRIAEAARSHAGSTNQEAIAEFDGSARAFKMSLGEAASEEGALLFRECIENGYILLGWGEGIDWSGAEYDNIDAIDRRWREKEADDSRRKSGVAQVDRFRNQMAEGDLVIVTYGNLKFRAIGIVAGPYEYISRDHDDYVQRRAVEWLWHDDRGLSHDLIYGRRFHQQAIYRLDNAAIDWPALNYLITANDNTGLERSSDSYVLIIDEINRADTSKVFGELITLLEPDKRLGQENELRAKLPYSNERFGVPANLHIVGTMNSADRSIALLDTALRRRFKFKELMPQPDLLETVDGIDVAAMLRRMNERVEYLFDRDHQIGHAYFIMCKTRADLEDAMRHNVIPLLAEYFYEDWSKVWQVLAEPDNASGQGAFLERVRLRPPGGNEAALDIVRWRFSVRETFADRAFDQLVE